MQSKRRFESIEIGVWDFVLHTGAQYLEYLGGKSIAITNWVELESGFFSAFVTATAYD